MRPLQIILIALQAALAVEAVFWTLHRSCYRNKEDTGDDKKLENGIIKGIENVKVWAEASASKIDESLSKVPLKGIATRIALEPLLGKTGKTGKDGYIYTAPGVRDKFKRFDDLEGPVGREGGANSRYERSQAWERLATQIDHHYNFYVKDGVDEHNPLKVPYDSIRRNQYNRRHDFVVFLEQEGKFTDWNTMRGLKVKAATMVDSADPPLGHRLHVAESINLHPLFVKHHRDRDFRDWTKERLDEVTSEDAPDSFKRLSDEKKIDLRPVDGLLDDSFTYTLLHEVAQFFHLTNFGRMSDDKENGAYGWVNNVNAKNRKNPDLYAIIGAVINLLHNEGKKYRVSADGHVRAA
ncbi:hypothetical protein CPLU01_06792 [Colletotrichum plurivorum]|uniref:Uncharacterized protein n=1 Tax=Colletotrichum plurivorum TaxID=2175906 RepID=A0A8H6KHK8_9PEZI|nr:hypothetical protein CPLU01_06792 [Colletotrichum plurivorum]